MFEPAKMHQSRPTRTQIPHGRNPFMFQNHQQMPLNRSPMNFNSFLPTNFQHYAKLNKGISGFAGVLDNVQQVLRVVETTTPIIKEYGPMIKNLPAMYRMIKAFKDFDGLDEEAEGNSIENHNTESQVDFKEGKTRRENGGRSTPKLFI